MQLKVTFAFCILGMTLLVRHVLAEESFTFELPRDPAAWINSGPVSIDAMRGKAIVLYFFERRCPTCRKAWPSILESVRENQAKPVLLIAVSSGSARNVVAKYVNENNITVPVIVDFDRSFEKAAGVGEVSLSNIQQTRMVDPEGKLKRAGARDIAGALSFAAEQASWNVDPTNMPPELMPTWMLIEFGNFAPAAKMMAQFSRSRKTEVKAAAQVLQDYIDSKIIEQVALAESASEANESWKAYRLFEDAKSRFAGYELPEIVEQETLRLSKEGNIQEEINAMQLWEKARKTIQSGRTTPAGVVVMLSKIVEKYPTTEAAQLAQAALKL